MRLSRLFLLTTGLLLSLVTVLLVRSIWVDWRMVGTAEQGLAATQRAHLAMLVAEKASAERGPAIPVLNDDEPPRPELRARLTRFREATDRAFDTALAALADSSDPASTMARAELTQARRELTAARAEVERVAALPAAERHAPGQRLTRQPIDQMFAVIDTVLGSVTTLSAAAEAVYPELALPLVGARYAAELREYAGRLGSQFTIALATKQPLDADAQRAIPELIGRIEQLHRLIALQAHTGGADANVQAALVRMDAGYFAISLPFIRAQAARAQRVPLDMDSATFVSHHVPPMDTIVQLRDTLFNAARQAADIEVGKARDRMRVNAALGIAVLGIELAVFLLIRRRVLLPLLRSTRAMKAIMAGDLSVEPPPVTRRDEMGDMKRAVAALRDAMLRRRALESEREQLFEQLRIASDTDFLTGLPNRRAFTHQADGLLAQARRHDWRLSLLMFDLDHFKNINDRYGHLGGDQVLREVASRARHQVRQGELLARLGGEEFVVLAIDCSAEQARKMAERLRATLANTPVSLGGSELRISASFGLATLQARQLADMDSLLRDADRALYQAKANGRNRICSAMPAGSNT